MEVKKGKEKIKRERTKKVNNPGERLVRTRKYNSFRGQDQQNAEQQTQGTDRLSMLNAFFQDKNYRPMRIKNIAIILEVPKEEREELRILLKQLVDNGRIYEDQKGCYHVRGSEILTGTFSGTSRGFGFVIPMEPTTDVVAEGENQTEDGNQAEDGNQVENQNQAEYGNQAENQRSKVTEHNSKKSSETGDIFVPEKETKGAMHGDTVQVQITDEGGSGKRREGTIVKILKRENEYIVGTFDKSKNYGFVVPDNTKLGSDIFISKEHSKGAVTGHKVYVKITDYGNAKKNPEGRVVEILGHINDPATDLATVLKTYHLETEFSDTVMQETACMPDEVSEVELIGRLDLRNELTVTIDGEDAKDLDDAITIEKKDGIYTLGVHIADVTHYVKENSPLDQSALARGTSVYLINKVIPMLPHALSNGICSLNASLDRLALSCIMEIDENGNIIGHKIAETVINVTRRMSYTEVEKILQEYSSNQEELQKEYGELLPKFLLMKELSDILRDKRMKRGALDFDFAESKIELAPNGKPIDIKPYERNDATKLIEDFMLAANETIAEDFFWQELPFVYRTHETPDEEKIKKLKVFVDNFGFHIKVAQDGVHPKELQKLLNHVDGSPEAALIARLTLRSMKQAKYTTECEGHFGLAAKYYCHFTSPIRRYPDLQIHRIIKENLHGTLTERRKEHYHAILEGVASQASKTERTAEEAERDVEQLKKIEYMADRIGEVYEGIISGVTNWGIYVELPNTIEGLITLANMHDDYYVYDELHYTLIGERFHKTYRLGQHITIQVVAADKLEKVIDFLPYHE